MSSAPPTIEDLERWRLFGAGCRIVEHDGERVVFEMCTCTGETVERHESRDADLIAYLIRIGEDDERPAPAEPS